MLSYCQKLTVLFDSLFSNFNNVSSFWILGSFSCASLLKGILWPWISVTELFLISIKQYIKIFMMNNLKICYSANSCYSALIQNINIKYGNDSIDGMRQFLHQPLYLFSMVFTWMALSILITNSYLKSHEICS